MPTVQAILDTATITKLKLTRAGGVFIEGYRVDIPEVNIIGLGNILTAHSIYKDSAARCCGVDEPDPIPLELEKLRITGGGNYRITGDGEYRAYR